MPAALNPVKPIDYLIVCNEGNFMFGNASISLINLKTGEVVKDIYQQTNGTGIGDVLQSISEINGKYYAVVNNSQKIVVLDTADFKLKATISSLTSPRYIFHIGNNNALSTDLYSNSIHKIDLNLHSKTGSIPFNGWSEKILTINDKLFIPSLNNQMLYTYDLNSLSILDSISIPKMCSSILKDQENYIWLLSSGDVSNNIPGKIIKLNATLQKLFEYSFQNDNYPTSMVSNAGADTFYYINKGIYQFIPKLNNAPGTKLINQPSGSIFYNLAIEPNTSRIWICDAKNYVSDGSVMKYDLNGNLLNTFTVGKIPGYLHFK